MKIVLSVSFLFEVILLTCSSNTRGRKFFLMLFEENLRHLFWELFKTVFKPNLLFNFGDQTCFDKLLILFIDILDFFSLITRKWVDVWYFGEINWKLRCCGGEKTPVLCLNFEVSICLLAFPISLSSHEVILLLWAKVFSFVGEGSLHSSFSSIDGINGESNKFLLKFEFLSGEIPLR